MAPRDLVARTAVPPDAMVPHPRNAAPQGNNPRECDSHAVRRRVFARGVSRVRSGALRLWSNFVNIVMLLALLLVPTGAYRFPECLFSIRRDCSGGLDTAPSLTSSFSSPACQF